MTKKVLIDYLEMLSFEIEGMGVIKSSNESAKEFVEAWFGRGSLLTGEYHPNGKYMYIYEHCKYQPKGGFTAIVNTRDAGKVYLVDLDHIE